VATKSREQLCAELAEMTLDYRAGELCAATPEHVEFWLDQFDEAEPVKTEFLSELTHVLKQTYFSKAQAMKFLAELVESEKFTGDAPKTFWSSVSVLNIQQGGHSQTEFRALLEELVDAELGVNLAGPDNATQPFIYLDDALFSGNRVVWDIRKWLPITPPKFSLRIVVCALHSGGAFRAKKDLMEDFRKAGKQVDLVFWRAIRFDNKSNAGAACDVLRLRALPPDPASAAYVASFGDNKPPAWLRPAYQSSTSKLYSSEATRDLLERVFWKAGLKVRAMCPQLKITHRPLGYTSTNSTNRLGFGSLFISFRNCPNNAPLALWAGDPWYPLFERKAN
jgi:hypothetical protein